MKRLVVLVRSMLAGGAATLVDLGSRDRVRQAKLFVLVHLTTLALNAVLFDLAMRGLGPWAPYWALRMVVSHVIYLTWSFPMFRRVFRVVT